MKLRILLITALIFPPIGIVWLSISVIGLYLYVLFLPLIYIARKI